MAQYDTQLNIGRVGGALGLAIEDSPGSANTTPDVWLSLSENTLRGHMEPIEDISSRNSRIMDTSSLLGRRWTEGDLSLNADVVTSGWLWKMALGNELYVTGTPNNHTFYATVSGNTPLTATFIHQRGSGDTLTLAAAASTTPLSEFSLTLANNSEVIHRSGMPEVSAIRSKGLRVSGSSKFFFFWKTKKNIFYHFLK